MKNIKFIYLLLLLPILSVSNNVSAQTAEDFFKKGLEKQNVNKFEIAIDAYTKAIKMDTKYEGAYLNRGVCKYELKNFKGAIEDYDKVLELNATYPAVLLNRALAKIAISDYEGALADLNKAISQNAEKVLLSVEYYERGVVYIKLGKNKEACEDIAKAKELGYNVVDEEVIKICK